MLTAPIRSMTEFKQIIGRGTRVFEGKDFFTIIDFVGATNLFYDDAWDGLPEEQIDDTTVEPDKGTDIGNEPKQLHMARCLMPVECLEACRRYQKERESNY